MNIEQVNIKSNVITPFQRMKLDKTRQSYLYKLVDQTIKQTFEEHGVTPHPSYKSTPLQQSHIDYFLDQHRFIRGFLVTMHLPNYLSGSYQSSDSKTGKEVGLDPTGAFNLIKPLIKRFRRRLEKRVFPMKRSKRKRNMTKRLECLTVIEGCYSTVNRNHIHIVVETPEHLSMDEMEFMIRKSHGSIIDNPNKTQFIRDIRFFESQGWNKRTDNQHQSFWRPEEKDITKDKKESRSPNSSLRKDVKLGSIHITPLMKGSKERLYTYLTKEVTENRNTVDWENSYQKQLVTVSFSRERVLHLKLNQSSD